MLVLPSLFLQEWGLAQQDAVPVPILVDALGRTGLDGPASPS
jgi:hypothetical protein